MGFASTFFLYQIIMKIKRCIMDPCSSIIRLPYIGSLIVMKTLHDQICLVLS
jgi:hypothetical protein